MQIRCPHCQNPIEVVQDDESFDHDCPSCGSSFNLASDVETIGQEEPSNRSIGHFELVEQVGMGAFGTVYKACDSELDRSVAVKIPRQSQVDGPQAEQFLREARAEARRALSLDSQCAEAHTSLGFAASMAGSPQDAHREYRMAIQIDHEEWLAHRLLEHLSGKARGSHAGLDDG